MRIILQLSGGKDSHASIIWAVEKYGANNIEAVLLDTKWEKSTLYPHVEKICEDLEVKLTVLTSKKYDGMIGLVEKKGRFPSITARFCTTELKVVPFIDYLLDEVKDDVLIIQGIRADESPSRAEMEEQCTFFKYYFQPHTNNFIKLQRVERFIKNQGRQHKKIPISKIKERQKLINKLTLGEIDNKYYSYRKKEVKQFVQKYVNDVLRPMFYKTGQEVVNIITDAGHEPFESYFEGASRVGCYPCVHSNLFQVYQISIRDPKRIDEIEYEEQRLNTSFLLQVKFQSNIVKMEAIQLLEK